LRKLALLAVPAAFALLTGTAVAGDEDPVVKVKPNAADPGTRVTVSGRNWGLDIAQECPDKIKLYLIRDGEVTRIRSIFTNGAQSTFSQGVVVPNLAAGTYTLKAVQKCFAEDADIPTIGRDKTRLTIR
jgi:hypothetical protein